jgi:hypothetical protein
MPSMRRFRWLLLVTCAGCSDVAVGCGTESEPPAAAASTGSAVAHGDHSPHHGGVVMMKGDLHYEAVLDPRGHYRIYFTDAMRADLPAATAKNASITIVRPAGPPEGIELRIDEAGESWIGEGRPVADPGKTTARISYTIRGEEPYWIDLPFLPAPGANAPDPHVRPPAQ